MTTFGPATTSRQKSSLRTLLHQNQSESKEQYDPGLKYVLATLVDELSEVHDASQKAIVLQVLLEIVNSMRSSSVDIITAIKEESQAIQDAVDDLPDQLAAILDTTADEETDAGDDLEDVLRDLRVTMANAVQLL